MTWADMGMFTSVGLHISHNVLFILFLQYKYTREDGECMLRKMDQF